ncbi:MAG: hypothetical protein ACREEA_06775, partial [Stellaceae bacterium]
GVYVGVGTHSVGVNNTYNSPGSMYSDFKSVGWSLPPPSPVGNTISFESEWFAEGGPFWRQWEGFCNFASAGSQG